CGRRIRKYMMTNIAANGSSDINMLLVSPPTAWAKAGVIHINFNPLAGPDEPGARVKIRADYSGRTFNCNAASPPAQPGLQRLDALYMSAAERFATGLMMSKRSTRTTKRKNATRQRRIAAAAAMPAVDDASATSLLPRIARALEQIALALPGSTATAEMN